MEVSVKDTANGAGPAVGAPVKLAVGGGGGSGSLTVIVLGELVDDPSGFVAVRVTV